MRELKLQMVLKFLLRLKREVAGMTFLRAARICLYAFLVFVPFQVKLFFQVGNVYQTGHLNLYTHFFLYLSDIFLVFALIFLGLSFLFDVRESPLFEFGDKRLFAILLVFVLLIEVSSFWAGNSFQSFIAVIRFVEFLFFYFLIVSTRCSMRFLVKILLLVLAFQSILGISQYIFQSSLGFSVLGEPMLSRNLPGVAKVDLGLTKFLRSYGTFVHPNVFGGFLVFGIILAFSRLSNDRFLYLTLIVVMLVALVLTFSRSAWLALLFAGIFYVFVTRPRLKIKYIFLGLAVFLIFLTAFDLDRLFLNRIFSPDDAAFSKRIEYTQISKDMFLAYPFGVGVGNFTLEMQNFASQKLSPWDIQPVHNVFLLAVNEVGILIFPVFVLLFLYTFIAVFKKSQKFVSGGDRRYGILLLSMFFMFVIVSNLDHYPFSLYQGQFLFFLYLLLVNDFILRRVPV